MIDPGGQSNLVHGEDVGERGIEIWPRLSSLGEEEGMEMARRPRGREVALIDQIPIKKVINGWNVFSECLSLSH